MSAHEYSPWRHGGSYVHDVHYPSGAVGCVSRNYPDRKWRIVCDPRPWETAPTFKSRDAAADGELVLIEQLATWRKHVAAGNVYSGFADWAARQEKP